MEKTCVIRACTEKEKKERRNQFFPRVGSTPLYAYMPYMCSVIELLTWFKREFAAIARFQVVKRSTLSD